MPILKQIQLRNYINPGAVGVTHCSETDAAEDRFDNNISPSGLDTAIQEAIALVIGESATAAGYGVVADVWVQISARNAAFLIVGSPDGYRRPIVVEAPEAAVEAVATVLAAFATRAGADLPEPPAEPEVPEGE